MATMADPYNTNLAAEFYVLSMLHRRGAEASLTLGNKKSVDIAVVRGAGRTVTIDVKGVAKRWDWPADNVRLPDHNRHFLALVSFEGKIREPEAVPNVWVIPARKVAPFLRKYRTRTVISRAAVEAEGTRFRAAWHLVAR
ncbi:MAG: hypothetical protein DMD91_31575 [Candidatus Rokuibacteriota bacterium]|nr:MAG: hypothetical protein DMD91_31575 [Candidatus Rokubacteria bacterium]